MPVIFAADLDTMTMQDLGQHIMINVKDKYNMNAARFQKIRRVSFTNSVDPHCLTYWRTLVEQRAEESRNAPLNASDLDERLNNIQQAAPPSQPSRSPTPGPDEFAEECRTRAYHRYSCLLQMGGRPATPINADPGVWNPSLTDEHLHVLYHWEQQARRTKDELDRWEAFRKYQGLKRESSKGFEEYRTHLEEYLGQVGFPGRLHLDDIGRQREIDDWKEYYVYERRKLGRFEKVIQNVEQLPQADQWLNDRIGSAQRAFDQHMELLIWIQGQLRMMKMEGADLEEGESESIRPTTLCHTRRSERLASKRLVPASHTRSQGVASRQTARERFSLNQVHDSKVSKLARERKVPKLPLQNVTRQKAAPLEARCQKGDAMNEPYQSMNLGTKRRRTWNLQETSSIRPETYPTSMRKNGSREVRNRQRLHSRNVLPAVGSPGVRLRRSPRLRQLRKK